MDTAQHPIERQYHVIQQVHRFMLLDRAFLVVTVLFRGPIALPSDALLPALRTSPRKRLQSA